MPPFNSICYWVMMGCCCLFTGGLLTPKIYAKASPPAASQAVSNGDYFIFNDFAINNLPTEALFPAPPTLKALQSKTPSHAIITGNNLALKIAALLEKARLLLKNGNIREAALIATQTQLLEEELPSLNRQDPQFQQAYCQLRRQLAQIWANLGAFYEKQAVAGSVDKARDAFNQALCGYQALTAIDEVAEDWGLVKVYASLAALNLIQKNEQAAWKLATCSLENLAKFRNGKNNSELPSGEVAKVLEIAGLANFRVERYQEALELYRQAEPFFITAYKARVFRIADLRQQIGKVYLQIGEFSKAELLFQQSQELYEAAGKSLGEQAGKQKDLDIDKHRMQQNQASLFQNMGLMARLRGNYDQAETLYQRALDTKEQLLGRGHLEVASVLQNLGVLYEEKGDYTRAEKCLQEALQIRTTQLGAGHQEIAPLLSNLGLVYKARRDYTAAADYCRQALAISTKTAGGETAIVGRMMLNLSLVYQLQNKFSLATKFLQKSIVVLEKTLGADSLSLAKALNNLATLKYRQGQYRVAEKLYQRVLAIHQKHFGNNHPGVAKALQRLGLINYIQGNKANALKVLAQGSDRQFSKRLGGRKIELFEHYQHRINVFDIVTTAK
jgi:tetratricopeptide (TPR) repeat protein